MQLLPFHYCSIKTRNGTCRRSLYNCKDNDNVGGSGKGIHRRDLAMAKTAGWLTEQSSGQPKTLTGLLQNEDSFRNRINPVKEANHPTGEEAQSRQCLTCLLLGLLASADR